LASSAPWALLNLGATSTPTNVARDPSTGLPSTFALSQNYPNPFNPSTTIEFAVPEKGRVKLEIYNILGQKIATLIDGVLAAGEYQSRWDAVRFGSGVYFSRLTTEGNVVLTRKMLLLK
ncbi:MAG: T9SS type A sorting domain-containing protein, partial [Ignavibacteriales bacterium]|nr:T9SS type A sorting domain-containing protein [Ignavibacteriales bacterium]